MKGCPSGSWKVMPGLIDVKTVCWIGSTTSAVSARTGSSVALVGLGIYLISFAPIRI